jgi:hypothetical protein
MIAYLLPKYCCNSKRASTYYTLIDQHLEGVIWDSREVQGCKPVLGMSQSGMESQEPMGKVAWGKCANM